MDLKSTADTVRADCDKARKIVDALASAAESFPWIGGYVKLLHLAVDGIDEDVDAIDDAIDAGAPAAPTPETPAP